MLVYVTDKDIAREVDLTARDVFGNDCTEDLILSIVSDKFRECNGDYGLEPSDTSRAFFRLSDDAKEYFNTTVEYAMSRSFYNMLCGLIAEWHILVKELKSSSRYEKVFGDTITSFPHRLQMHLIGE